MGPLAGVCCVENPVVDFEEIVRLGSFGGNVTRRSSNDLLQHNLDDIPEGTAIISPNHQR